MIFNKVKKLKKEGLSIGFLDIAVLHKWFPGATLIAIGVFLLWIKNDL